MSLALYNHFWFFIFVGVSQMGVMHGVLFFVQAYAIHLCVWDGLVEPGSLIEIVLA